MTLITYHERKTTNDTRLRQCVVLNVSLLLFIFVVIMASRNPPRILFRSYINSFYTRFIK